MTTSVTSPEQILNNALVRIGYKRRIGSIWEGSEAAKRSLDIYAQTRDQLLRTRDWGFSYRNIDLTLLKQAPAAGYSPANPWTTAYPPLPYLFEYDYPVDCLRIRAIKRSSQIIPNFDPQYNAFGISNDDAYSPPKKVILCNVPDATATYVGQITDPQDMEADFIEALTAELARRLAPVLVGLEQAKLEAQDAAQAEAEAASVQG